MNLSNFIKNIKKSLIKSIQLQLFVSLLSIPILTYWGIPISLMSPLGNLFFTPFLMFFLLLSSAVFFLELLCIPNGFLVITLEKFTQIWMKMISLANVNWLIHMVQTQIIYSIIFSIVIYLVMHHKKLITPKISIGCLLLIFSIHCCYLTYLKTGIKAVTQFYFYQKEITFIKSKNKTALIDPGALSRNISAPNFVKFDLIPNLIKMGINGIDFVIVLRPSITILKTINELCQVFPVKNIYINTWSGKLSAKPNYSWKQLMQTIQEHNIKLFRIYDYPFGIKLDEQQLLIVTPQNKKIKKNMILYSDVKVTAILNDQSLQINSL